MNAPRLLDRLATRALGPSEADLTAGLELAVSARQFSRRATAVLDDKLSFSAALMRAGEVDAATRLLAEVEEEVLTEEAALLEVVNEVKVARSMERPPLTRMRLARTLAVAMLGSSLLAFSATGMAIAGLFRSGEDRGVHREAPDVNRRFRDSSSPKGDRVLGRIQLNIAGVPFSLSPSQQRRFEELTSGNVDEDGLETFLLGLLPTPLAEKVRFAIVMGMETLPAPVKEDLKVASRELDQKRKEAQDAASDRTEDQGADADENGSDPSPEPSNDDGNTEPDPDESPDDEDGTGIPLIDGEDGDS